MDLNGYIFFHLNIAKKLEVFVTDEVDLCKQFNELCQGVAVIWKVGAVPSVCEHCKSQHSSIIEAKKLLRDEFVSLCEWHRQGLSKKNLQKFTIECPKVFQSMPIREDLSVEVFTKIHLKSQGI